MAHLIWVAWATKTPAPKGENIIESRFERGGIFFIII